MLLAAALARGIHFDATAHRRRSGSSRAAALFTVGMYGVAETLASRVPRQEEYIARVPAIAILPWFLAGSLFPITALPGVLTWVAKLLPLTHALALMRYGLLGDSVGSARDLGHGRPDRDGRRSASTVVSGFALLLTLVSIRVFNHSAVE